MADGLSDVNCTVFIERLNGIETDFTGDIFNYSESSLTRKVNYTKTIGGLILPRKETAMSKEISFDFISNDISFEILFDDTVDSGTINYSPESDSPFEIGDVIEGVDSGQTATITDINTTDDILSINNISGSFTDGEEIIEQSTEDVYGRGTVLSFAYDSKNNQSNWDTFDKFKISLLFDNGTEIHKRIFYNCYITEYESKINEGVLEGTIKFTFPMKNINGDSNFYIYNLNTDNDSVMGW